MVVVSCVLQLERQGVRRAREHARILRQGVQVRRRRRCRVRLVGLGASRVVARAYPDTRIGNGDARDCARRDDDAIAGGDDAWW